tara:strand:+ start:148 stop:1023 length:876 start_codon:yes stop_codon:yes gene_type:complete
MKTARKPKWLRAKLPSGSGYRQVQDIVDDNQLHTVCESARCPNLGECWSRGTATLMILGEVCTRTCSFCAVQSGKPPELDLGEPARVAVAVAKMNLKHCVLTSVARDDLKDGGAKVWANVIRAVRHRNPGVAIEVLTPDFRGDLSNLDLVLDANPDIFNHNLETVERLQRPIRKTATYEGTLNVLRHAAQRGFTTKSGIMLGIGEKEEEIGQAIKDLAKAGVNILTIGQYLQPSLNHAPIDRWAPPEEFEAWKDFAHAQGLDVVESGPLVRSSYHAEEQSDRFGVGQVASA